MERGYVSMVGKEVFWFIAKEHSRQSPSFNLLAYSLNYGNIGVPTTKPWSIIEELNTRFARRILFDKDKIYVDEIEDCIHS